MWIYKQSTGELQQTRAEKSWGDIHRGYAGRDEGLNNPAMQHVKNKGPLPCGFYTIGEVIVTHPRLGVLVMELVPDDSNEMFGRGDFFLHGRKSPTDLTASLGCMIQDRRARLKVAASDDKRLQVVP